MTGPKPQVGESAPSLQGWTRFASILREQIQDPTRRWSTLERLALVALSALAVFGFLRVALARLFFPYELEWMEGGILAHVLRLGEGQPLYVEPTLAWTPFIYNPLYYYLGRVPVALLGPELSSLRLLSLFATLASFACTYAIAKKTAGSPVSGVLAVGLFALTYELSGTWFDLARVDSLAHALTLLSIGFTIWGDETESEQRSRFKLALGGVVLGFAFFAKQSTILVLPAMAMGVAFTRGLRGALFLASGAALVAAVGLVALHVQSRGWYWYYALELPISHSDQGREELKTQFLQLEMFGPEPVTATLGTMGLMGLFGFRRLSREEWIVLPSMLSLIVASYLSRLHMGSSANDLIPMHSALAVLASVCHAHLGRTVDRRLGLGGSLALVVQFLLLLRLSLHGVPADRDRRAGDEVLRRIQALEEPTLVLNHPHLAVRAGKPLHAHAMALIDIEYSAGDPRGARERLRKSAREALADGTYPYVVTDDFRMLFDGELEAYYRRAGRLPWKDSRLQPIVATQSRPETLYAHRSLSRARWAAEGHAFSDPID